jgi:hypothetical protein
MEYIDVLSLGEINWFIAGSLILIFALLTSIFVCCCKKKYKKRINIVESRLLEKEIRLQSIASVNIEKLIDIHLLNDESQDIITFTTNDYLNKYLLLINHTLQEIDRPIRYLEEELEYVEGYLELEKQQFEQEFTYQIIVGEGIIVPISVPNMLIYTYCENAIRHAFHDKNAACHLRISVIPLYNGVHIEIEDNGIGRKAAEKYSRDCKKKGLFLLARQIKYYNKQNKAKITQEIFDLKNDDDQPIGTQINLYIPYHFKYVLPGEEK